MMPNPRKMYRVADLVFEDKEAAAEFAAFLVRNLGKVHQFEYLYDLDEYDSITDLTPYSSSDIEIKAIEVITKEEAKEMRRIKKALKLLEKEED